MTAYERLLATLDRLIDMPDSRFHGPDGLRLCAEIVDLCDVCKEAVYLEQKLNASR